MRENAATSAVLDAVISFVLAERGKFPISEAWLFGSYAEGKAREDSDIDLGLVLDREVSYEDELELFSDAQKRDWKIETHVMGRLDFDSVRRAIIHEIKTKGIRIA